MKLILKASWFLALSATLLSCRKPASKDNNPPQNETVKPEKTQTTNLTKAAIMERVKVLGQEKADCNAAGNNQLHDSCGETTVSWSKSDFNWDPAGSTVLVMEETDEIKAVLGRYKARMRDILEQNSDGSYVTSANVSAKVSKGFADINEMTGHWDSYFSTFSFSKNSLLLVSAFQSDLKEIKSRYLDFPLSIIGEYVPSANFVVAPLAEAPANLLCSKDWNATEIYFNHASESIAEKVKENSVSAIHISWMNATRYNVKNVFSLKCPGLVVSLEDEDLYLNLLKKFYTKLEILTDIVVVQDTQGGSNLSPDYPFECGSNYIKNGLRIGRLPYSDSTKGKALKGFIEDTSLFLNANKCVDVVFKGDNVNVKSTTPELLSLGIHFKFYVAGDKIDFFPFIQSPLATVFMISQKNTMFKDMNGEQIVKKMLAPGVPVIYDPLGNRQLEAFEKNIFDEVL